MNDLRTIRKSKGLRIEDLASGLVQPGTIISIERGERAPQAATRAKIESLLGPVDWRQTLAGPDRKHIMSELAEFVNEAAPGAKYRISFLRQCLQVIELTLKTETKNN